MEAISNVQPVSAKPPFTAFNYDTQKWVVGEEARLLRISQLYEEVALLNSVRGQAYFLFSRKPGSAPTRAQAIAGCMDQIADLSL